LCFLLLFLAFAQLVAALSTTQEKMEKMDASRQNWDLSGEFLIWYASEQPSSLWANATTTTVQNLNFTDHVDIAIASFDWNYGFRVGIGHTMEHDQWDTQLYWAWFRTSAASNIPTVNALINTVYLEFDGSFLHGDLFLGKAASINWSLLFNMLDWELGRNCLITKALSMRPFIGIKGGCINQNILAKVNLVTSIGKERLENHFWGIGPSGGLNTAWTIGHVSSHSFNLFGDFSAATMWGNWHVKDVYHNGSEVIPVKIDMTSLGSLMLRGFLGIGWDTHTSGYRIAATLGYEMQIWFNQLRIPTVPQLPVHGDLTLQGGIFNARFDF
jgi:Legionella pneumophila major outer membrane protein precursor